MEFGFKFWFLVAGALLLLGVLVHGLWLTLRRNRGVAPDAPRGDPGDDEAADDPLRYLSSKLSNGGGRVAKGEQEQFPFDDPVPVLIEATGESAAATGAGQEGKAAGESPQPASRSPTEPAAARGGQPALDFDAGAQDGLGRGGGPGVR